MWCSSTACGIQETWLASATQPRHLPGLLIVCPLNRPSRGPNFPCYAWRKAREAWEIFTIEFFRIRPNDHAHATLDRLSVIVDDLDAAKVKASSLFETLEMPQKPDGLRILDESGCELFFWNRGEDDA